MTTTHASTVRGCIQPICVKTSMFYIWHMAQCIGFSILTSQADTSNRLISLLCVYCMWVYTIRENVIMCFIHFLVILLNAAIWQSQARKMQREWYLGPMQYICSQNDYIQLLIGRTWSWVHMINSQIYMNASHPIYHTQTKIRITFQLTSYSWYMYWIQSATITTDTNVSTVCGNNNSNAVFTCINALRMGSKGYTQIFTRCMWSTYIYTYMHHTHIWLISQRHCSFLCIKSKIPSLCIYENIWVQQTSHALLTAAFCLLRRSVMLWWIDIVVYCDISWKCSYQLINQVYCCWTKPIIFKNHILQYGQSHPICFSVGILHRVFIIGSSGFVACKFVCKCARVTNSTNISW